MAAGRARVRTTYNKAEQQRLARTRPFVEALSRGAADQIQQRAQREAPVSRAGSHGRASGYLRRNIVQRQKLTSNGTVVRVMSFARTPKGFPYGLLHQQRRPYIRPIGR